MEEQSISRWQKRALALSPTWRYIDSDKEPETGGMQETGQT